MNTARDLKDEQVKSATLNTDDSLQKEPSAFSLTAQVLANPVTMPEYVADKIAAGIVTAGCILLVNAGITKYKEAKALRSQIPVQ